MSINCPYYGGVSKERPTLAFRSNECLFIVGHLDDQQKVMSYFFSFLFFSFFFLFSEYQEGTGRFKIF